MGSEPALPTPPQAPAQSRCLRLRRSAPGCGPSRLPLARDVGGRAPHRRAFSTQQGRSAKPGLPGPAWEQCSQEPQTPTAAWALPPGACVPTHLPQLLEEAPAPRPAKPPQAGRLPSAPNGDFAPGIPPGNLGHLSGPQGGAAVRVVVSRWERGNRDSNGPGWA